MTTLQKVVIATAFSITCFTVPVLNVRAADSAPAAGPDLGAAEQPEKPAHPAWARPNLPEDVRKLLGQFRESRQKFLQDHQALAKQLRDAAATDRARIREQLKADRKEFLESQKELRAEIKQRIEELKKELPQHREVIDAAKEKARQRRGRGRGGD